MEDLIGVRQGFQGVLRPSGVLCDQSGISIRVPVSCVTIHEKMLFQRSLCHRPWGGEKVPVGFVTTLGMTIGIPRLV